MNSDEPLIVFSYLDGETPFQSGLYPIFSIQCRGDHDYYQGLDGVWNHQGDLVIVEHDMEVSDDLIARILATPEPLVAYAYTLHWASIHAKEHYAQKDTRTGEWIREGWESAGYSGIGFVKIAPEARVRPLEPFTWQHADVAVDDAIDGEWRVLWPEVEHYHY